MNDDGKRGTLGVRGEPGGEIEYLLLSGLMLLKDYCASMQRW